MKISFLAEPPAGPGNFSRSADELEAAFLGEMLKIAMPDTSAGAFGGGVGESHFASFLTDQHAEALAQRIDLGLMSKLRGADA